VFGGYGPVADFPELDWTAGSLNLGTGNFQMSTAADSDPATAALVQSWLNALVPAAQHQGALPTLLAVNSSAQQSFITEGTAPGLSRAASTKVATQGRETILGPASFPVLVPLSDTVKI
jgi:hypothetical protein